MERKGLPLKHALLCSDSYFTQVYG